MATNQRSVTPDATKLTRLRHHLGWTQQEVANKSGYSVRLIRKIEKQKPVRPQTLRDVVQCYSNAMQDNSLEPNQFIFALPVGDKLKTHQGMQAAGPNCPYASRIHDYYDAIYNQRRPERVSEFAAPDIRFTSDGELRIGIEAIMHRANAILDAFDPIEFSIDQSFSRDRIVASYWSVHMQHVGNFLEIPATGKWAKVRGTSIVRFEGNLVVEAEDQFDVGCLIRQLRGQQRIVL